MRVVIAIDSFKGSLSCYEAGQAAAEGVRRIFSDAETIVRPAAGAEEGSATREKIRSHGRYKDKRAFRLLSLSVFRPAARCFF